MQDDRIRTWNLDTAVDLHLFFCASHIYMPVVNYSSEDLHKTKIYVKIIVHFLAVLTVWDMWSERGERKKKDKKIICLKITLYIAINRTVYMSPRASYCSFYCHNMIYHIFWQWFYNSILNQIFCVLVSFVDLNQMSNLQLTAS